MHRTGGSEREVLPGLVVGQELARSLRLHVGDEVTVVSPSGDLGPTGPIPRTRAFRIAGIFYTGMFEYDMQMAYTDLATAQSFLRSGDEISGIEARLHDWSRADEAALEVRGAVDRSELRIRSWREVNRNLFGALELEKLAMFITLGIAILVASFCIFAALVLMVQEKGREVGILKAMGAEDRAIVGIFLVQGLLIGVLGAMSGLDLVCFAAEHFKFIRMNPEVYYIDRLPVNVDPVEFLLVGLAAVVVCVLATIYPAVLGSRLRPVDALRQA
jgi:lipoprotein-releasing system permease protein